MTLLLLACAEPTVYPAGPEVFDEPLEVHESDDFLFAVDRINRIDLEVDEDAQEILRTQRRMSYPRDEVRVEAWVDGEEVGEIGLRMRGGLGSFTRFDHKPKWELDFNEYSGERFHGLESLSLNNMIEDCSSLRETVSAAAYGLAGAPTSRTGYAQLFVNGQDYGLYTVIETQDDRWLDDTFPSNDGTFYDGKYQYKGGVVPYFVDFGAGRDHWFDQEEGEEGDRAEIAAISAAVEQGQMGSSLWSLVDWDNLLRVLAVERFLGDDDGVAGFPNNYRVYFQPGLPMRLVRWDLDASLFVADGQVALRYDHYTDAPGMSLARLCMDDADCRALFDTIAEDVQIALMNGDLLELAQRAAFRTQRAAEEDPRRGCRPNEVINAREAILAYLETGDFAVRTDEDREEEDYGCQHTAPKGLLEVLTLLLARRR